MVGTSGPWSWERSPEELIKARAEVERQTLDGAWPGFWQCREEK